MRFFSNFAIMNVENRPTGSRRPFISFIVTAYNLPEEMLRDCLQSLLALPLRPDEREILLVDDGSEPAVSMQQQGVSIIRQDNLGAAAARNAGLGKALGEYVQFVDGDDIIISPAYADCLDFARRKRPDVLVFDYSTRPTARLTGNWLEYSSGASFMSCHNLRGAPWGYFFKRDILGSVRFTQGLIYGEDEEFTARLFLEAGEIAVTNAKAYYYRQHEGSLTSKSEHGGFSKRLSDNLRVIERLSGLAKSLRGERRKALDRRVAQLAMDLLYNAIRRNRDTLPSVIKELKAFGLFPLPNGHYTLKYDLFRKLTLIVLHQSSSKDCTK